MPAFLARAEGCPENLRPGLNSKHSRAFREFKTSYDDKARLPFGDAGFLYSAFGRQLILLERLQAADAFEEAFPILEQSFPEDELRTRSDARRIFAAPSYRMYAARREGRIAGVLAAWKLAGFRFVEHFAVLPACRGEGLGGAMMREFLSQEKTPVLLEVDAPDTPVSVRRVGFYERLGFSLTPFGYAQPPLRKGGRPVPLRLMSWPRALTEHGFSHCRGLLFREVYQVQ